MCFFSGFDELGSVPLSTIIISATTSGAITTRDELSQVFVTTATCPPHGSDIVAIEHVLHCIHTEKAIIVGAVVAVKVIIGIMDA